MFTTCRCCEHVAPKSTPTAYHSHFGWAACMYHHRCGGLWKRPWKRLPKRTRSLRDFSIESTNRPFSEKGRTKEQSVTRRSVTRRIPTGKGGRSSNGKIFKLRFLGAKGATIKMLRAPRSAHWRGLQTSAGGLVPPAPPPYGGAGAGLAPPAKGLLASSPASVFWGSLNFDLWIQLRPYFF